MGINWIHIVFFFFFLNHSTDFNGHVLLQSHDLAADTLAVNLGLDNHCIWSSLFSPGCEMFVRSSRSSNSNSSGAGSIYHFLIWHQATSASLCPGEMLEGLRWIFLIQYPTIWLAIITALTSCVKHWTQTNISNLTLKDASLLAAKEQPRGKSEEFNNLSENYNDWMPLVKLKRNNELLKYWIEM